MKEQTGWAIVQRGRLGIFDSRVPVFWLRRIAREYAQDHGFTTFGPEADCRIIKVRIAVAK